MNPTVSLILPCYNEGDSIDENVRRIYTTLHRMGRSYEILFVDDASGDGTQAHIARYIKKYPHTRAIYHAKNKGRGAAVTDGIKKARGKIVGYIDIDCEVSPIYIPDIVETIIHDEADVIIGKRIYRTSFSSLIREILSVGYRWIVSHVLGTRGLDTESGYKFFRKKKIIPILRRIHDRHWFWDTEIIVYSLRKKLLIVEVPVLFIRRLDKKSTVHIIRDTLDYLFNLWKLERHLTK